MSLRKICVTLISSLIGVMIVIIPSTPSTFAAAPTCAAGWIVPSGNAGACAYIFTQSSDTVTVPDSVTAVDILAVGAGGGGASGAAGQGGAGGGAAGIILVKHQDLTSFLNLGYQNFIVSIGIGGSGGKYDAGTGSENGQSGGSSTVAMSNLTITSDFIINASGGGGGFTGDATSNTGSGGSNSNASGAPGTDQFSTSYGGGGFSPPALEGGGGAGANTPGITGGATDGSDGGQGGDGSAVKTVPQAGTTLFSNDTTIFAAGGGGSAQDVAGSGGSTNLGGAGGLDWIESAGTPALNSGSGGGGGPVQDVGSAGADGYVEIRYQLPAAPPANPLTITSISPDSGTSVGGTTLTITGTGIQDGATVTVGGNECSNVSITVDTSLTCTVPTGIAGPADVVITNVDRSTATQTAGFTYTPYITQVSPGLNPISGGDTLTITGIGFVNGATVTVGGNECTNVVFISDSELTCIVPTGNLPGSTSVRVGNPDSSFMTIPDELLYILPPLITSISPSAGNPSGGETITITGAGFQNGATVTVGGAPCTGLSVVPSTKIVCTLPAGTAGNAEVKVLNPDTGFVVSSDLFHYRGTPTITSFSPQLISVAGGETLTINGTGFLAGATITVGGKSCTNVVFVSSTKVICTVPAADQVGTATATLTNPDSGSVTSPPSILYISSPTITSISPVFGMVSGGETITITGTNFDSSATVTVDGIACANVHVTPTTSITCTVPSGTPGSTYVIVTNGDSGSVTNIGGFIYVPAPTITTISPATGTVGGGTSITVAGYGFAAGATVTVGGAGCAIVSISAPNQIICTTPSGSAGAANVVVTNLDGGVAIKNNGFTYLSLVSTPTITSITPATGTVGGGTTITIIGTGFTNGATVTVGGLLCTNVSVTPSTSITCKTPPGSVGAKNVVVTNLDGGVAIKNNSFTYVALSATITITSITPSVGSTSGGTSITINGSGFLSGATVTVGGFGCTTLTFNNSSKLTCITPPGNTGSVNVVVTNPGSGSATKTNAFTYQAPIACFRIFGVTPNRGNIRGGTFVTITGCGFGNNATVKFGGVAASIVGRIGNGGIVVRSPAHARGVVTIQVINSDSSTATFNGFNYTNDNDLH